MNTVFYNMDDARTLNNFVVVSESEKSVDNQIYIPLYVAQFGGFELNEEIIYAKRGLGFFLATDALSRVNTARREEFYETTLHEVFNEMDRLQISIEEIVTHYNNRK